MFTPRKKKFDSEVSEKVGMQHQVLLCDAVLCECVRLVYLGSIKAFSVASPFTLP